MARFKRIVLSKPPPSGGESPEGERLRDAYLGFVVIKPLPQTFIGRTCLKTYDDDNGRRHYPVTRDYPVHLAGLELSVRSLAFQEQDTVVAACATSALWSVLHGTGVLFHHRLDSPVEITRHATRNIPSLGREMPNRGLQPLQMAAAIRDVGLEPEVARFATALTLKATAYAYLKERIPLVLCTALYDTGDSDETTQGPKLTGYHAVAVTGYSLGSSQCTPNPDSGTLFASSRIDKLYVHDDQVGPFARIKFGGPSLSFKKDGPEPIELTLFSSWRSKTPGKHVLFAPDMLILPLYHKIRIGLDAILDDVFTVDERIEEWRNAHFGILREQLVWDVFLSSEESFKEELRKTQQLGEEPAYAFLEKPLPRFVWRAIAWHAGAPLFEKLYDATDIEQGDFELDTIKYTPLATQVLEAIDAA